MTKRAFDLGLLAALSVLWTWPLALHFSDHVPGPPGDNFTCLWNLWWMRHVADNHWSGFFHSTYLFNPFGVDLVNHPHTALQGAISATLLSNLSVIQAQNVLVIGSIFLNAAAAYALAYDVSGQRRLALLAGVAFGDSPYIAAHLFGHFELLAAWVLPLFALFFRRALDRGSRWGAIVCGLCVSMAAYSSYYYVVYLALFAVTYTLAPWRCWQIECHARTSRRASSVRLAAVGAVALDVGVMLWIRLTGGGALRLAGSTIQMRTLANPLLIMWLLFLLWAIARWHVQVDVRRPPSRAVWRGTRALAITVVVFALASWPLIVEAYRLVASGRYVSQVYFWRSAPRGVDLTSFVAGHPYHPIVGGPVSRYYGAARLNVIEQVAWLGVVPLVVLGMPRGRWLDAEEARRWKVVLGVFLIWALGPFLSVAGVDLGLPLPETLARFVPLVENAHMPGRAMMGVYLALGVLMALRLAALDGIWKREGVQWALIVLLAFDYLNAPVPLTSLDRPVVYQRLASIGDGGAVIEVPFGIGDGLTAAVGAQSLRILYYATIHGHPLVGGFIGRMPPGVGRAYEQMPIVGNLLRLSNGQAAVDERPARAVPFRYVVLDTTAASPELAAYTHAALDLELIERAGDKELYAVRGTRPR